MHNLRLGEWLTDPVTKIFMDVVRDHIKCDTECLSDTLLGTHSLKDLDLHLLSQLRGQIYTLERVLDIHEFITEEDLKPLED